MTHSECLRRDASLVFLPKPFGPLSFIEPTSTMAVFAVKTTGRIIVNLLCGEYLFKPRFLSYYSTSGEAIKHAEAEVARLVSSNPWSRQPVYVEKISREPYYMALVITREVPHDHWPGFHDVTVEVQRIDVLNTFNEGEHGYDEVEEVAPVCTKLMPLQKALMPFPDPNRASTP